MWRFRNFIQGIKNLIFFFKVIWNYRWWDYSYSLQIFKRSLEQCPENYEKYGYEVDYSRLPKVKKMKRLIELLNIEINDDYIDLVEKEMGFKYLDDNPKHDDMFKRIHELEEESWKEIWDIVRGSDSDGTSKFIKRLGIPEEDKDNSDYPNSDGTNMRSWWD